MKKPCFCKLLYCINNNNLFRTTGGGGGGGRRAPAERRVYVSNIPYEYKWQDLKDLFRKEGKVEFAVLFIFFILFITFVTRVVFRKEGTGIIYLFIFYSVYYISYLSCV